MDAECQPETSGNEKEDEEETEQKPQSSLLFPLFPLSCEPDSSPPGSSKAAQWLSNPSFTFDVSTISAAPAAAVPLEPPHADSDEEEAHVARRPTHEPVPTSSSSEGQQSSERKEKVSRKKRKRKKGREDSGYASSGKSTVRTWIDTKSKPVKDYYFDVHGDRDNLAFGCLYRMNVPRYKLDNIADVSELEFQMLHQQRFSGSWMDPECDLDVLDGKIKAGGRYYSVKFTALEKNKGFKHLKILEKQPSLLPGEYMPLVELSTTDNGIDESKVVVELEESWEDELVRRTRELNKMSRDFPHDENVWLAFAEFQDKVASTQPQKAARLQTLEKKISILEKAVELNPDNEELILCLLKSYKHRDSIEALMEKWEKVLTEHFDNVRLWKEYLLIREGEFSLFKVSDIRKAYGHAIRALSSACNRLCRQDFEASNLTSTDNSLVQLEVGLVDIFINLCRFEWQTGHQELATGLFQAEIEYSLFSPSLLLSSHSKQRLFEHFWNSSGARIGEDGAFGWSAWLDNGEQSKQNTADDENKEESDGGWTGWMYPFPTNTSNMEENAEDLIADTAEEDPDNVGVPVHDNIEALLKKLGIDVDANPNTEVKDAKTWNKWSQEEMSRDSEQWMPVREHHDSALRDDNHLTERDDQLSRVILFDDINDFLFSLCSEEARYLLVSRFVEFFRGIISHWTCTNSVSWMEKVLSLDSVEDSFLKYLDAVSKAVNRTESSFTSNLDMLLCSSNNDLSRKTIMMKFLRNGILLCLDVFPRNHVLEEAVLVAEELSVIQDTFATSFVNPSRALGKTLLRRDHQNLLLCGLLARREAAHGNMNIARNIFDMALSSADALPKELMEHVPVLCFWYAEMEMAASTSGSNTDHSSQRAMHILYCLGSNVKYSPFVVQLSGLKILRTRHGFKEQIKSLRSAWAHGDVKESSIALICSASLFEFLTSGGSSGIQIIEEAFSMALPERRTHSSQLELLWMHYIATVQKYLKQLSFSRVWEIVAQSLQMYPYNPKCFSAMVEISSLYTVPHRVRLTFDRYIQRKPSVVVWLFALEFEMGKSKSEHRIHGLFEKALSNDKLQKSVLLWRCYLAYEADIACNPCAARRIFFRAIHACPWSKRLWLDGFQKLSSILTAKELSDLHEVMRDKEIHLRTDIYEILLQDEL
ncbi:hypothetical protein AXF42_Ash011696 [Apostasia shenzhenica]|uniref:Protein NRDE2 homolog n=1 Tax=Apostasia shenzhenica TaxID=1088818 RepID=A0A2H9ZUQ0_9ASPA|nr:hypothetical protein AXF42_Ash011696 [Apostasia shenzhenica]